VKPLWVGNRKELPDYASELAARQGGRMPQGVFGIKFPDAKRLKDAGQEFVYFDHAYFDRGWHRGNFRAIRNGLHLTSPITRPDDRLKRWNVQIKPWKKSGSEIIVIPPSETQTAIYECKDWLPATLDKLKLATDRRIIVKAKDDKRLLQFYLDTAHALVTYASVAGVEAAIAGVPVFATENCPAWQVSAGPLDRIEKPVYAENRHQWACGLAYASWNWDEMKTVKWDNYRYETCA
jgi:hypothetical protein